MAFAFALAFAAGATDDDEAADDLKGPDAGTKEGLTGPGPGTGKPGGTDPIAIAIMTKLSTVLNLTKCF